MKKGFFFHLLLLLLLWGWLSGCDNNKTNHTKNEQSLPDSTNAHLKKKSLKPPIKIIRKSFSINGQNGTYILVQQAPNNKIKQALNHQIMSVLLGEDFQEKGYSIANIDQALKQKFATGYERFTSNITIDLQESRSKIATITSTINSQFHGRGFNQVPMSDRSVHHFDIATGEKITK